MEHIEIIQNDNIQLKRNYTAAHKRAQRKYNAQHVEKINENKLKWYHNNKDTQEFKARLKIHNKNTYQKRKERIIKEKLLNREAIINLIE